MMNWLFGTAEQPANILRKNQRALNKAMRDLDREKARMEQQEKKLLVDIKKMAKEGQMDAVKIMVKDLVRTRHTIKKFMLMRANIQAVSLKVHTLKSQDAMSQAMLGVSNAMKSMNRRLNIPQVQKIMMDFERQTEIMDMKEEVFNDTMDDALGAEDDEAESDAIVKQVLDELGLQMNEDLSGLTAPSGTLTVDVKGANKASDKTKSAAAVGVSNDASDNNDAQPGLDSNADLQARLDHLRRK